MTFQMTEQIIFRKDVFDIIAVKGTGLLTPIDFGTKMIRMSTACNRGYLCKYAFIEDKLYLTEMEFNSKDGKCLYKNLKILCPLLGGLLLGKKSQNIFYYTSPYPTPLSYLILLEIKMANGAIIDVIDYSSKIRKIFWQVIFLYCIIDFYRAIEDVFKTFLPKFRCFKKIHSDFYYNKFFRLYNNKKTEMEWKLFPGYAGIRW